MVRKLNSCVRSAPIAVVVGQQSKIGIQARGARVIVAGADMRVTAQSVVILAHHQDHLAVRLEPHHAVGDVDAVFLELLGELDVGGFVETGLEFDHHGDLLAVARGVAEIADHLGIARGAVERHLDRPHLGVFAGLAQQPSDRGRKRFIRMHQQDRAGLANHMENVARRRQARVVGRMVRRIVQRGNVDRRQLHQIAQRQHPVVDLEHVVVLVKAKFRREHPAMHGFHAAHGFHPHDRREAAIAQLGSRSAPADRRPRPCRARYWRCA